MDTPSFHMTVIGFLRGYSPGEDIEFHEADTSGGEDGEIVYVSADDRLRIKKSDLDAYERIGVLLPS